MSGLPVLGVGVTYCSGIEPLLASGAGLVNVLEVEPQTLWYHAQGSGDYRLDSLLLERIAGFPCRKLVHSVGCPVGGSRPPERAQLDLIAEMARALHAPWMSEHLSFNRAANDGCEFNTGFLLPPRQTAAGAACAVENIRTMARAIPIPLAVETGVSYLRPLRDEMSDGEFVRRVTEEAGCGILLDLHNVWTNERNGRQKASEFLEQIPLDRVWELHLAGGSESNGYWLDSHSDAIPAPLLRLASSVMPRLPNLRAVIFEIFPAFLPVVGLDLVRSQLESLHELWSAARTGSVALDDCSTQCSAALPARSPVEEWAPSEWEDTLGALAVGRQVPGPLAAQLSTDRGLVVMQGLVEEFRASMVVSALPLTFRLLVLTAGEQMFRDLLTDYWRTAPPEMFASAEAEGFAVFLAERHLPIRHLAEVLEYERALLTALVDRKPRVVRFEHDPLVILRALGEGRLPETAAAGKYEIELTTASSNRATHSVPRPSGPTSRSSHRTR